MVKKKKYKILMVHNYYQIPGGEDTVVSNEKKLLEENGHDVILYTRNNNEINSMNIFRKLFLPFTVIFNFKTYFDVKKIIKNNNIDIVHVHNTTQLISPSVFYAALSCKIPVIQTLHNFRLICPNGLFFREGNICEECVKKNLSCSIKYKCYRNSSILTLICVINTLVHRFTGIINKIYFICLTDFNREKISNSGIVDIKRIYVKPNFSSYLPIANSKDRNGYVYAGRLEEYKGIKTVLHAWKILGDNAPVLNIFGSGELEEWCINYKKVHKLSRIRINGIVDNLKVLEVISQSKAVILPTYCYEAFPMNIVEAFSVGTPVIGSRIGNTDYLIANNVIGSKFETKNEEELAEIVRNFKNHNSKEIIDYYNKNYSSRINIEILENIYTDILKGDK